MEALDIKIKYTSERDNIIEEFYTPVLSNAIEYKRAVGYFTSNILVEYMTGLLDFYKNGGKMKLIISPHLLEDDIEALKIGNINDKNLNNEAIKRIENQLVEYLKGDKILKKSTELFILLMVNEILEVKIAMPKNEQGLFHEKIGIFTLLNKEKIAIIGSNNETYRSISINHESFNTFSSWKLGQNVYIDDHEKEFDRYWNEESKNLYVFNISEAFVKDIFVKMDGTKDIVEKIEEIELIKYKPESSKKKEIEHLDFEPYGYQETAAKTLLENKGGILEFATGSGKTKTAIYFMELLKKKRSKNFFIIVVPDKTLLEQWYEEIKEYNDNVLRCNSDYPSWRSDLRTMINIYKTPQVTNQIVITTVQTMYSGGLNGMFFKQIKHLNENLILIVDELHRMSTNSRANNLPEAEYKVGLSATPFNNPMTYNDKKISKHFGGIVARYTLEDAIRDKKLVPYNYYPLFVELTFDENERYKALTKVIISLINRLDKKEDTELRKQLELTLFNRARIVYGALNKISTLEEKLKSGFIANKNLLVYCGATSFQAEDIESSVGISADEDGETQLQVVNRLLKKLNIPNAQYTEKENRVERIRNIKLFEQGTMSTLSAIKCLDEGVDIPQIENAVIMASSGNKREFIQRRGRVLRKSPGKEKANIYDFVVIDHESQNSGLNMSERTRVIEFAKLALNYEELIKEYKVYMEGEIYGEEEGTS